MCVCVIQMELTSETLPLYRLITNMSCSSEGECDKVLRLEVGWWEMRLNRI